MQLQSLTLLPEYVGPSTWWQHVPIAHWLIAQHRPSKVVELGSHYGVSFFAFCEAAEAFSPTTFIYAVDTWAGDEHAGAYDNDVYGTVRQHWTTHHKHRARLVRSTFDEAAEHFPDASIDLLHIDGLHTYEAVKHDYETWLPKLSADAVVLFHDINVRERNFGVWKLWEELTKDPDTFSAAVMNGHGLGILCRGQALQHDREALNELLPILVAKGVLLDKLARATPGGSFESLAPPTAAGQGQQCQTKSARTQTSEALQPSALEVTPQRSCTPLVQ